MDDKIQLNEIAPVDIHPVTLPHFAGIKKLTTKASSGNITAANAQLMVNEFWYGRYVSKYYPFTSFFVCHPEHSEGSYTPCILNKILRYAQNDNFAYLISQLINFSRVNSFVLAVYV